MNKDMKLLRRAYDAWLAAEPLRRRRERHKRYTYGDQWSDPDTDCNGRTVEERRRIIDSGKRPLTNNLIRQLVKTIVGRYRTAAAESGAYDTSEGSFDRRLRVIETWQLAAESAADSAGRQYMAVRWQCTWLAPDGTVLSSYASPYGHGSHPFAVKHYPLTDGEIHSFVEDVIDQQRTINRLVVLIDTMLASSAKGALLFPVEQLPRGVTIDDVSRLWASPDAVIPVTGRAGAEMPRQVVTNTADSGAYQLLNLQMKLFGDVSGISDALLGRNVAAATGSSLYDAQVRNAAIALADLLETFASFTAERSDKAAKTYRN